MPVDKPESIRPGTWKEWRKFITSFSKRDWRVEDYPITFRYQGEPDISLPERKRVPRWVATIDNWHLAGTGETREDAMTGLRNTFERLKHGSEPLPRPGIGRSIVFASTDRIDKHPELRDDFIQKVLQLEWAFLSDESSLWDFHEENDNSALVLRVGDVYGVDVSQVEAGLIADILDQIVAEIHDFPEDEAVKYIRLGRDARTLHILGEPLPPWNE